MSNDESIVSNDENTAELPGAAAAVALRQDEPPPVVPAEPAQVRPLDQSLFGSLWPERDGRPRPGLLAGSVAVGVLAGALLPYRGLGVGVYLVLLLGGALVLSASGYRGGRWTRWCLVMCLALGSLVVVRADEELAVPAVAMAGLLATTALTGARRFAAMAAGPIAWVLSGIRGLPLLGATMRGLSRHRMLWPAVRTLLVSVLLLVVFGALFSSADAIFGAWTDAVLPRMDWDSLTFRAFLGFVIGGVVLAGCYLAVNPPLVHRLDPGQPVPARHAWEWQVPLVLVDLLFVVFVAAQWQTFFGGHDYLMRTTGLSYATSVHQGFAQLTVATAATLVLVAAVSRKAARRSRADRVVLRVLAGVLCLLTLVVVASALYRMQMYQQAYGFTVLRLLVDAFEAWLGLVVLFVLAAGVRLSGRWVPRAVLSSAAVSLLAVGLANPAGWAAAHNIDRYQSTGRLDAWYLTRLGDDAAPAIAASALPDPLRACLVQLSERPAPPLDAISWNLGRSKAAQLRESLTTGLSPLRCAAVVDAVHAPSGKRSPAVAAGPVTAPGRDRSPRA